MSAPTPTSLRTITHSAGAAAAGHSSEELDDSTAASSAAALPPFASNVVHQLAALVRKRIHNMDYLRRVHTGSVFWMNSVLITHDDLRAFCRKNVNLMEKRTEHWFFLGISMAPLLAIDSSHEFVRGLAQLLEEYEYYFSNAAVQGMKRFMAWTSSGHVGPEEIRPTIHKTMGSVVYEFLRTPNIPIELDFLQVVVPLCELLTSVYQRFMDERNPSATLFENVLRLDARLKHHFFGALSRDINTIALAKLRQQLQSVDSLFDYCDRFEAPVSLTVEAAPYSEQVGELVSDDEDEETDSYMDGDGDEVDSIVPAAAQSSLATATSAAGAATAE